MLIASLHVSLLPLVLFQMPFIISNSKPVPHRRASNALFHIIQCRLSALSHPEFPGNRGPGPGVLRTSERPAGKRAPGDIKGVSKSSQVRESRLLLGHSDQWFSNCGTTRTTGAL